MSAWTDEQAGGHGRISMVSVSRSIFALVDDRDRMYFGERSEGEDKIGFIDENTRAIFGRSYAAEPDMLIKQLKEDEAVAEAVFRGDPAGARAAMDGILQEVREAFWEAEEARIARATSH